MSPTRLRKRLVGWVAWTACLSTFTLTSTAQTPGGESLAGPCSIVSPEEAASVLGLPITPGGLHKRWVYGNGEVRTVCHFVANASEPVLLTVLKINFPTELAAREYFEPPPDEICQGDGCSPHDTYSWRKARLAKAVGRKRNVAVFLTILPHLSAKGIGMEVSDVQLKKLVELRQRALSRS